VIGSHEDLEAASVDNVKAFFAKYYVPSNASLVIAGDFSPKQAKETIEKWFASMPAVPVPVDPGAPDFTDTKTSLEREVRSTVTDNVQFPKVVFSWQTPKHLSPEDAHLDLLSNVLAGGKASRLYKRLVEGKQLAQEVSANQSSGFLGSQFSIDVLAKPGVSLEAIETEVGLELQELAKNGPTKAELTRSRNLILSGFVSGLQTVRARASLLNAYESEKGDPGFLKHDVARYESATPHDLQRAVATYLGDKRVVLRVMPKQGGAK
jgi:zinc protease